MALPKVLLSGKYSLGDIPVATMVAENKARGSGIQGSAGLFGATSAGGRFAELGDNAGFHEILPGLGRRIVFAQNLGGGNLKVTYKLFDRRNHRCLVVSPS